MKNLTTEKHCLLQILNEKSTLETRHPFPNCSNKLFSIIQRAVLSWEMFIYRPLSTFLQVQISSQVIKYFIDIVKEKLAACLASVLSIVSL